MVDSILNRALNRSPTVYKSLFQAKNSIGIIFGQGGLNEYLLKRSYFKRFKDSWVYMTVPLNDKQMDISVGRYSYSINKISVGYVPIRGKRYRISIGSFTQISGDLTIIISKTHTFEHVANGLNGLFLDRRGRDLYHKYHKDSYGTVEIGNDVYMGVGVTIIGNVKIGDGAVVGAKAVVTKDVEPYSVVVGAPARRVRYRFEKKTRDALLRIKWWNWDDNKILERLEDFYDIKKFVKKYS